MGCQNGVCVLYNSSLICKRALANQAMRPSLLHRLQSVAGASEIGLGKEILGPTHQPQPSSRGESESTLTTVAGFTRPAYPYRTPAIVGSSPKEQPGDVGDSVRNYRVGNSCSRRKLSPTGEIKILVILVILVSYSLPQQLNLERRERAPDVPFAAGP